MTSHPRTSPLIGDRAGRRVLHRKPHQAARHRRVPRSPRSRRPGRCAATDFRMRAFAEALAALSGAAGDRHRHRAACCSAIPRPSRSTRWIAKARVGAYDRVRESRRGAREIHRPSRAHGVAHDRRLPADGAHRLCRGHRAGVLGRLGPQHGRRAWRTTSASSPTSSRGGRRSTASSTTRGSG